MEGHPTGPIFGDLRVGIMFGVLKTGNKMVGEHTAKETSSIRER